MNKHENTINVSNHNIDEIIGQELPVCVPRDPETVRRFEVLLGGQKVSVEYHYGTPNQAEQDTPTDSETEQYSYQGDWKTQSIDSWLGKREAALLRTVQTWNA